MKHYGFFCWLRRHTKHGPDMKAYALTGVVVDYCRTCSRDALATVDLTALAARGPVSPDWFERGDSPPYLGPL